MGRLEVQGIVSTKDNSPYVQCRQFDENDVLVAGWQLTPYEAREMAQRLVEAAMNGVYDAAIMSWARETWSDDEEEEMGRRLLAAIRDFRADVWGLPDRPKDWT